MNYLPLSEAMLARQGSLQAQVLSDLTGQMGTSSLEPLGDQGAATVRYSRLLHTLSPSMQVRLIC